MRRVLLALCLSLLAVSFASAAPKPRPFLDLDFEAQECTSGWTPFSTGRFETLIDGSDAGSGRQSIRLRFLETSRWDPSWGYAIHWQAFPAAEAAGRKLRLSGLIRTEDVAPGYAGLWWTVEDSQGNFLSADFSAGGGGRRTTPWTRHQIEIDVPSNAARVLFGVGLSGGGTAWFDALSIEVDGHPYVQGKQAVTPRPTAGAVNWLRKAVIPFATAEAGNGFDDLQPLRKLIGDARIVSLGEGTHGTREFFQMKHRLLEFLVEEMGFTHFSIEANMPEAYRLNDYVLTGKGNPRELLKGMYFWTWNTQEVLDMILWMREYNASGKGPVQFTGFDMQFAGLASANVRNFLKVADGSYAVEAGIAMARADAADNRRRATAEDVAAARSVYEHMQARRGAYLARFATERVDFAIQNARVVVQCLEDIAGIRSRDESMAENVDWILDYAPAGSKIVLWAHNMHVSKRPGWMGKYLQQRHDDDMVVLGFAYGAGRYNALDRSRGALQANETLPPVPNSVETYLGSAGIPRFILDLRRVPNGAPAQWLKTSKGFRHIGAVAARCAFGQATVADDYDALIWFDHTNPSVLLPFN